MTCNLTFTVYDATHATLREYMCPENYVLPPNSRTIQSLCNMYSHIRIYLGTTFTVYDATHAALKEYIGPENFILPLNSLTIKSLCNIYLYVYRHDICNANRLHNDYKVAKTHRMLYIYRSFPAKEFYN